MEHKHTPGPWTVTRADWDEETGDAAYTLDGVKELCIADARLIAAAPDLLEALQAVVDAAGPEAGPEIGKAEVAIAKATGQSTPAQLG